MDGLSGIPERLDGARLGAALSAVPFVTAVHVLEETVSTNDALRRLAADGAGEGTVVVSDLQTGGRGRLGRSWWSPPGLGLYLSVLVHPRESPDRTTRWTLAAAVAGCEACRAAGCDATIDWPNDLMAGGRKLAGILAEQRVADSRAELVLGIGINVAHGPGDFPEELRELATSLRIAAPGKAVDRESVAIAYLDRLGGLAALLHAGDWAPVARAWEALAPASRGVRVRVGTGPDAWHGLTRGIDDAGALRIEAPDGRVVLMRSVGAQALTTLE